MTAFDDLANDPRTFLWNTPIAIAGSGVFGTTPFQVDTTDMTAMKANPPHATTCNFRPGLAPGHRTVWNVPMINNATVVDRANITHVHVTDTNDPFILTGKLSGCCVVVAKVSNTELRIAHIQPGGTWSDNSARGDGEALEETLQGGATLGGVAATHICGVSRYRKNATHANFIGVVSGGAWQLWVQATTGSFDKQITHLSRVL